jgi:hypothetical protein
MSNLSQITKLSQPESFLILRDEDLLVPPVSLCEAFTKSGKTCKNKPSSGCKFCHRHSRQYSLEKPDECPVCMESTENIKYPLQCGHWIHLECLLKWREDTCPMCRELIKFTRKEKIKKNAIHRNQDRRMRRDSNQYEDVEIPYSILELIESLLQDIPEERRNDAIVEFLQIDLLENSIIIGHGENREFSRSEIDDFPDISD